MLTLLLGGARSGKSAFAVRVATRTDRPVTYVATSPRIDGDLDLAARIETHRAERPPSWRTIEEEVDLDVALASAGDDVVIVDCLTLWTSNLLWRGVDDTTTVTAAARHAALASQRAADTIVISNEVGLGVHPSSEVGRRYRDLLGRVNQEWSRVADRSLLLVAGRALVLHDPEEL